LGGDIAKLRVENLYKSYTIDGEQLGVLNNINIEVQKNEFLVVLGPGLCGKTVLLNIMAGLETADRGRVLLDGKPLEGPQRSIGVVFQKTGLFPWKNVISNVEFGPKIRGVAKTERREKCYYFLNLVGLKGFEKAHPHQLSGGMKQRVGIARAYANDTEILLMDEPFGALDAQTRYLMQEEILRIWEQEKRTVVFVTNNIEEALFLGDRIVLLSKRPAELKEIYIPTMPKPRDNMAPEFLEFRKRITDNTDLAL